MAAASPAAADSFDSEEFELRKHLPPRFATRKNDVYITKRTNFGAQMARCEKLLEGQFNEIYVHGLGNAVNRAINLSLQLKRRALGSIDLDVNTSTMEMTDDLIPLVDDADFRTRSRFVSAVHIRVFRPDSPVDDY
uniref:Ribonuclease P protein subunit p20 n=1 Tax=Plectus sambesii TaxID=2011161 RepID=A0A914WAV0_9BILA